MRSLSYKQKHFLLLAGFIAFFIIAYKLSFSETLKHRSEIKEKETKITWLGEKEKDLPFLKAKLAQIEQAYSKGSISIRDKLTAFISDFAEENNCTVTEIPFSIVYKHNDSKIETNSFTIRGGFKDLLILTQSLEQHFGNSAKIVSVHYYSRKENQNRNKKLYLTVLTQSFKKI
jgi:hypothetical protein